MIRALVGVVAALVAVPSIAASEPISPWADGPSGREASTGCIRDVSTPTAVVDRPDTTSSDVQVLLSPEAAVIAPRDDSGKPIVVGGPPGLSAALRGTRVWAASPAGFVVSVVEPGGGGAPEDVVRLVREIGSDGAPVGDGRTLTGVMGIASWGDDVLVAGPHGATTLEPGVDLDLPDGLRTTVSIDSDIGVVPLGASGGAVAPDGSRMTFDDVDDLGARGPLSVGGVGRDRLLIRETVYAGARYWVWVPAEHRLSAVATVGPTGEGDAAMCGDLLYVVDHRELRVIDTSTGPGAGDSAIVSRRPLDSDWTPYEISAVPGGLALTEYRDEGLQVTWFRAG